MCLSTSCPSTANAVTGLGLNPKLREAEKWSFRLSSYSVLQLPSSAGSLIHRVPESGQLTLGISGNTESALGISHVIWMQYSSIYLQMIEINITNLTPSKDVKQINLSETNFYGRRVIFKWLLQYKCIHTNHLKFWSVLQIRIVKCHLNEELIQHPIRMLYISNALLIFTRNYLYFNK